MNLVIFSFYFNREKEVDESINSLILSAPIDSHIVLVNDGSTDETLRELMKFRKDKRVKVINQCNKGFVNSLQETISKYIAENQCEFLAIHGSGDICHPNKFKKQIDFLQEHPKVVALGSGHEVFSARSKKLLLVEKGLLKANKDFLINNVPFTHGTVIYRRDAFIEAGGYDKAFKYCQDWEFYHRLIDYGEIIRYPEVLYTKYIFEDGSSFKPSKKKQQLKFKKLIQSQAISESSYQKNIKVVKDHNIDFLYPDSLMVKDYKKTQRSVLMKGEFKLAIEWTEIIYKINNDKNQRILKSILRIMILLRFPSLLISKLYKLVKKIKNNNSEVLK